MSLGVLLPLSSPPPSHHPTTHTQSPHHPTIQRSISVFSSSYHSTPSHPQPSFRHARPLVSTSYPALTIFTQPIPPSPVPLPHHRTPTRPWHLADTQSTSRISSLEFFLPSSTFHSTPSDLDHCTLATARLMTTVLTYRPMSDPFAPDPTTRYPTPPFSPPAHPVTSTQPSPPPAHYTPPIPSQPFMASSRMQSGQSLPPLPAQPSSRRSTPPTALDEFGYAAGTSSSSPRARPSHSPGATLPLPVPSSSVSADHHSTAATQGYGGRQRNRQSHNPSSTLDGGSSPPKPEYLTDEYVLHPSVWAYKQAHPRRPVVGFGAYVLLQTLGEGEFGKVKLGVHTEYGVEVAIKLIRRGSLEDEVRASKVEREIDVLRVSLRVVR